MNIPIEFETMLGPITLDAGTISSIVTLPDMEDEPVTAVVAAGQRHIVKGDYASIVAAVKDRVEQFYADAAVEVTVETTTEIPGVDGFEKKEEGGA